MAKSLFSTFALACAFSFPAHAANLSGPVDFDMLAKTAAVRDSVDIASPGGNMFVAMVIAQILKDKGVAVRVTGWCASGCAMIAIGSGNCTVTRAGRLILHAPAIPAGSGVTDAARALSRARADWQEWMHKAGVPSDLIEATLQAYRQQFELSPYAMKRVGCAVE